MGIECEPFLPTYLHLLTCTLRVWQVKKEEELQRLSDLSVALNFLTEHYIKSVRAFPSDTFETLAYGGTLGSLDFFI